MENDDDNGRSQGTHQLKLPSSSVDPCDKKAPPTSEGGGQIWGRGGSLLPKEKGYATPSSSWFVVFGCV